MGAPRHGGSRAAARRRAVAYLRASTRKQELSCADQLAAIEAYCEREGLDLVRVFRDDGVSGTLARGRRAAWGEMLDWIEAGHLSGGVVVVWSLDRWARDLRQGLLAAWSVGDLDAELHTTDSGRVDLDSTLGQLEGVFRLALAAQESRERSRRVRERKRAHLEAGYWVTRPPYGYRLEGSRGRKVLVPDPAECRVVARLFAGYDQGASFGELAGELDRDGLRTRHGGRWSTSSIQRILSGWSYGGMVVIDGRPRPIQCETFIPRDQWERCRERAASKGGQRGRRPRYPLSGLVACGECGRRMRVHTWPTRAGGKRRAYRCPGRDLRVCGNRTLPRVERLEAAVLGWWRSLGTEADLLALAGEVVAEAHAEAIRAHHARRPLEDELASLEAQELRLVDAIRESGISPVITRELERVRGRRREVEREISAAGAVVIPIDPDQVAAELARRAAAVDSPAVLREWLDEIVALPDGMVVVRGFAREGLIDA